MQFSVVTVTDWTSRWNTVLLIGMCKLPLLGCPCPDLKKKQCYFWKTLQGLLKYFTGQNECVFQITTKMGTGVAGVTQEVAKMNV